MNIRSSLEKAIELVKPYNTLLGMMAFFVGTALGVYHFIIRPQDLSVIVKKQEVNFPNSVNNKYSKVFKYLADSCKNNEVLSNALVTYDYLQNTNDFWIITLHNETENSLKGIMLRITGVTQLTAYAVNSTFLLDEEKNKLMNSLNFQETSGIVYLNKIESLPPRGDLKFYLWGKFTNLTLDENLHVNYEDGDAHVGKEITISGFRAYLSEYLFELFVLILLIFFLVYRRLINKYTHVTS